VVACYKHAEWLLFVQLNIMWRCDH
jgi:hypothetical protein